VVPAVPARADGESGDAISRHRQHRIRCACVDTAAVWCHDERIRLLAGCGSDRRRQRDLSLRRHQSIGSKKECGAQENTESIAVDDYVLGRGDLTPAIISSVFSWSSDVAYADNQAMLEWIRHYNALPTTKRKVRFMESI
jgi:hypothetical protein